MVITVLRESGLRIVIFTDDHEPAHVHVFGDGEAKIQLVGDNGRPELISTVGMKAGDVRKAMSIVVINRNALLVRWKEIHG